jgi:hypothetical protein
MVHVGVLSFMVWAFAVARGRRPAHLRTLAAITLAALLVAAWALQYLVMEVPLGARFGPNRVDPGTIQVAEVARRDFENFSLVRNAPTHESRSELAAMYERIRINNPDAYRVHPIGKTIDHYSARYGVGAEVLFFLNYIDSWYGEATSGPLPFANSMTSETVRDLVQVHLPAWWVEGQPRLDFIASDLAQRIAGDELGFKLRYAVHKATLDVSSAPYAINTFSDIFLVLREYPEEFPELAESAVAPLDVALRDSFLALRETALVSPYEYPYQIPPLARSDYDAKRENLKRFSRAAFYKALLDFDFATRVQALLTRYHATYFEERLGAARWQSLPKWQQEAMLVMIRDLYVPNVGRVGYNVYALPELNATPLEFVAASAQHELPSETQVTSLWRPASYDDLWSGAGSRLRNFSDLLRVTRGAGLPGLSGVSTVAESAAVVERAAER